MRFSVVTWEKVLDVLKLSKPEHDYPKLWHDALRDYMFPPKVKLSQEDIKTKEDITAKWDAVKTKVDELKTVLSSRLAAHGYRSANRISQPTDDSYYGWYITDTINQEICYFIGADRAAWLRIKEKGNSQDYLFMIKIRLDSTGGNPPPSQGGLRVESHILTDSGFMHIPPTQEDKNSYAFPLVDSTDTKTIDAEKLAEAAIDALNRVRDTLARCS